MNIIEIDQLFVDKTRNLVVPCKLALGPYNSAPIYDDIKLIAYPGNRLDLTKGPEKHHHNCQCYVK